jgi:Ca2+-binding RTX toxin-like protein
MAAVTVPGVGGAAITYTDVFDTSQNQTLAQDIANALAAYFNGDPLNIQSYVPPPGTTSLAVPSDANELLITAASDNGTVFTPTGYSFATDDTGGGSFTVVGAQNFIGGGGNLTVWDTVGAPSIGGGIDTITAGNGNDLFGLTSGSTYTVASGNGNDTFFANGSGAIADGTNLVSSDGTDTIIAGQGANTVATYRADPLIFGGTGSLEVFGNTAANETVVGSSGSETIFGAQSGVYFLGSSNSLFIGNPSTSSTIVGSTGSETMFGGATAHELIFNNSSSLLFASGSGDSTTIVGGSSPSTLFGSAGSATTYFSTSSAGGALYAAGTGNETLNAAGSTTNNTMFGGVDPTAGNSLAGGVGNDMYMAGTGSDTMVGGAGANVFAFDNGHAGGNDFIAGYSARDVVGLFNATLCRSAALAASRAATRSRPGRGRTARRSTTSQNMFVCNAR